MTINYSSHTVPEFGTGRGGREDERSHALGNVDHKVQAEAQANGHDVSMDNELIRKTEQADTVAKKRFSKDPEIQFLWFLLNIAMRMAHLRNRDLFEMIDKNGNDSLSFDEFSRGELRGNAVC